MVVHDERRPKKLLWHLAAAGFICFAQNCVGQNYTYDSLRTELNALQTDSAKLVVLDELAWSFARLNFDSAAKYYLLQKVLAEHASNAKMLARAYNNYAHAHMERGELDSARLYFERSLAVEQQSENETGIANMHHNLGLLYEKQGNSTDAMDHYLKALEIKEKLGDKTVISSTVTAIGFVYNSQDQYEKALVHFERALQLLEEAGVPYNRKRGAYNNIGLAHMRLKDYRKARAFYRKSVEGIQEDDNLRGFGIFYNNMGITYDENFMFDSAHYYYTKSLQVKSRSGDKYGISSTNHNIAVNYRRGGFPEKAIPHEHTSKKLAEKNGYLELAMKAANGLRESYEAVRHYDSAYYYALVWKNLSDSLQSVERSQAVLELQTRYETVQKDNELALQKLSLEQQHARLEEEAGYRNMLVGGMLLLFAFLIYVFRSERVKTQSNHLLLQKNKEIEEKSMLLARSLYEKEALLKEIHHRVKNNLQVISSILNMQSRNTSNPDMLSAIQEGQSRVKAMALIHQKLYQSERLSEIDFKEYAEDLLDHLSSVFTSTGIERMISATNIKLDIDIAIPLGLILNELISNAYKYAFGGEAKGQIRVELKRIAEEKLQLEVCDNGKGMPAEFSIEKTKSLGLKLVNILTRQLNGTLDIKNEHGTKFSITFNEMRLFA